MPAPFLPTLLTITSTASEGEASGSVLTRVTDWAVSLMDTLGGPGAGLAVAVENLFPPIPSEVILPLAGFSASRGEIGLVEVLVWTTAGSVVGALLLYVLGALLGRRRTRAVLTWMPLVTVADVDKGEDWFQRYGPRAVFFGRMVPIVRAFVSVPAGVERMRLSTFTLLTLAGSLIWNTIFVLAGYYLGESWHVVEEYAEVFQLVVIVAVIGLVATFVVLRLRTLRRRAAAAADGD